jgi:hypothetical protein
LKYLISLFVLISFLSCSHLKNETIQEPEKAAIVAPSYTGNWIDDGGSGPYLIYLSIYEETYKTPIPTYPKTDNESHSNGEVVALLKFVPKTADKNLKEIIYRFSGSRAREELVFLGGNNIYELGFPTQISSLKFKIPKDGKNGFTAWLEGAKIGGFFDKIPAGRHHDFTKLKFKRAKEPILTPSYTGKWIAEDNDSLVYLRLFEETYKTPVPTYPGQQHSITNGEVVALLKFVSKKANKNLDDWIFRFSGSRINDSKIFLGGADIYEIGIPTRTFVLKFKIPEDLKDGFTAWLEDSRTGGMIEKIPEDRNHNFTKLKFKKVME